MSRSVYEIVHRPLMTEKNSWRVESRNQYTFEVAPDANKVEIRQAVEKLFGVQVASINTSMVKGKPKRHGWNFHHTKTYKKAIVTLREGHKIELI